MQLDLKPLEGVGVVISGVLLPGRGARRAGLELTALVFLCIR